MIGQKLEVKNISNRGSNIFYPHLPLVVKKKHSRSFSPTMTGSVNSTLFKMENAGKARILCSLLLLFFSGNQIFATEIYTNIWAVKVHGGVQEVKKLAIRHGLSYERHVSKLSTVHLYTCKSFVSDSRIH